MASGSGSVKLVPLGGLGEIGMNCMAVVARGATLIVDCGTAFPEDDLGVDVLHPDFGWLEHSAPPVAGVFLTHGHEDHVGALPFLLSKLPVPLWGPAHALAVAEHRLKEHAVRPAALNRALPGTTYRIGPFEVEPVRVAHSIVEATALSIQADGASLVHSGDFKFDPSPPDGEPTDEDRLRRIGDAGVDLLMSDSTNVDRKGQTISEVAVAHKLEALVAEAEQRVVIALFASNVQRLISIGEIAQRTGRKICLLGRSLGLHVEIAQRIGRLHWPTGLLVSADQAQDQPRQRLLVLAGGTQGEIGSAMSRLASASHPRLKLAPEDTVIFSSRIIPGNDRKVFRVMTALLRQGLWVHSTFTDPHVHTSGHGAREEQQRMLTLLRPRAFMPIHGTLHHLTRHAALARDLGISEVMIVENGQSVELSSGSLRLGERVPSGTIAVSHNGQELSAAVLGERAELGRTGSAVFSLVIDKKGRIVADPELSTHGVPRVDEKPGRLAAIARQVADGLDGQVMEWRKQRRDVHRELQTFVRRALERHSGEPMSVDVHLLEI